MTDNRVVFAVGTNTLYVLYMYLVGRGELPTSSQLTPSAGSRPDGLGLSCIIYIHGKLQGTVLVFRR